MKSSATGRIISGLLMTTATAIPVVTAAELIAHVSSGSASPLSAPQTTSGGTGSTGSTTSSASQSGSGVRTVTGSAVQDPFGTVQATVTLNGSRITNVAISAPTSGPSGSINGQAIPLLRQETLQAQSANVNLISGATLTSQAYQQSLQSALGSSSGGGSSTTTGVAAGTGSSARLSIKGAGEESD